MTNIDRQHLVSLDRKAAALQKIWLRERDEQRMIEVAANAEIKRRWLESDSIQRETTADGQDNAPAEQASSLSSQPAAKGKQL
jgi:hypothetical protein